MKKCFKCWIFIRVGGLRERDYQLAAQRRNEACRRFDYNLETAKYFERESRLAHHFNSWNSRDFNGDKYPSSRANKAEKLRVRQNNLRKMLREEEVDQRNEMIERSSSAKGVAAIPGKEETANESVEELRKKLESKRAERALYYPNNYGCYRSCNGVCDSVTSCPRHYENERHIDACRNSQLSMEETNLRNYSTDCQGRKENPDNRHHGEKRHLQGHTIYGTNIDSFANFSDQPTKHAGERRHYESSYNNVDEGTDNKHHNRGDSDNVSIASTRGRYRDEQERSMGFSGSAPISERRHFNQSSADSFRSLAQTNLRQSGAKNFVTEFEIQAETNEEVDADREMYEPEESYPENGVNEEVGKDQDHQGDDAVDDCQLQSPGFNNKKNSSTDNLNFSWKYDDPNKRPASFPTHHELINQIQDLVSREIQACKKQSWSEALRLRDMRNRLELQREVEIFNESGIEMDNDTRRSEMKKLAQRIKLMDKRELGGNQHLIYSEEARTLWETRVREDEAILSKSDRADREILLQELEAEWEAMAAKDKERIAGSPMKLNKSHFQEELELTAAAMEKVAVDQVYHASNEESKNSCTRNKDKGASSLIFLG